MKKLLHDMNLLVAAKTDEKAFEELMPEFRKLIWFCYWKYLGGPARLERTALAEEDMFQAGMYGLYIALKRYDPERNIRFTSFAVPYIAGEMLRQLRSMRFPFHVPRRLYEAMDTEEAEELRDCAVLSLEEPAQRSRRDNAVRTWAEIIPDDRNWEAGVIGLVDFERVLGRMSEKDAEIVRLRFAGLPQAEIAKQVGCSQAQVSRILSKLKAVA
ncbi:MAG: sigma-70 family RNA polymerase sigma factor [Firmicutes bacterium]|nr:sigma-70 family RNA polymerase sigma factor [Bacillota bacterium]